MAKYPIFLELEGARVVVIGAGKVATRKVQVLHDAKARVVVVADVISNEMTAYCKGTDIELIEAKYAKSYLPGARLVIASTSDIETNAQIYKDCQELQILCNVVDDPPHCDFFVPAVIKHGDLQIAIGTDGKCPAYSGYLRKKLEQQFTKEHGLFLIELNDMRMQIIEKFPDPADRKAILEKLVDDNSFEYFVKNGDDAWRDYAQKITEQFQTKS
ncbi:MAG: bifunctional precorrin-2 dehydrogenase/sirohydrochlorin ferrochelatase [Planctomycetes bacterium]|nr:bifunctional precorrin-2 dehydrogenase/sirohydrochlorin ferrochelatase [Planctomycetota bacterium]